MADSARDIASAALADRQGNVTAHLERLLEASDLSPRDRAFATELAIGAVKRRETLRAVIRPYLRRPRSPLASGIERTLHVALVQVLLLDRVPDFAAVNEAVARARRGGKGVAGLVNAVLRNILRDLGQVQEGPVPTEPDVIPIDWHRWRRIGRRVFRDPSRDAAQYLAEAYSLPRELAEKWIRQSGGLRKAADLAAIANQRPPLICRVNAMRATPAEVLASLTEQGVEARLHSNGVSIVLEGPVALGELEAFRAGHMQPQDPGATLVGLQADARAGMRVLDFCAAPGTKTTHLAEMMRNSGSIHASDVSDEKLERIEQNCRRLGVEIVQTIRAETVGSLEAQSFDLVLVDAPCSNTGVLARRPEARWRFDMQRLGQLVRDQQFLLTAAAGFVRPGGRLVYSVCSIEPEEGSHVARGLGKQFPQARLASEKLYLPEGAADATRWHDGGYVAIFNVS